jgi:acetyl-CoA C-acetyltransferase
MKTFIVAAKRTPIGKFLGSFADIAAAELGAVAARAVLEGLPERDVSDVIIGNVLQAGNGMNVGRQIATKAGLPETIPGQTINRVCGSGMQAVITAVQALKAGDGCLYIAGGTENMSGAPYLQLQARRGYRYGAGDLIDSIQKDGLTDPVHDFTMGFTAENVASQWGIGRQEQDAFAVESQRRAAEAIRSGAFSAEIVEVATKDGKNPRVISCDEQPRPETTLDVLAQLKPVFLKPNGTVTAGNASSLNDGAAMLAIASEDFTRANGIPPIAEILSYAVIGVNPATMGIGPAAAIPIALKKARLALSNIDLFEINEAFASQSIAVTRELGIDQGKVNPLGGSIALGHPIGASGARILVTLAHELRTFGKELGVAGLCIGGGMGIATVVRNVS